MTATFPNLKKDLLASLQQSESPEALSEPQKLQLCDQLEALRDAVQPASRFLSSIVSGGHALPTCYLGIRMGLFDAFAARGNAALSIDDLRGLAKGDRTLQLRVLRLLSVHGFMTQVAPDTFKPTANGSIMMSGAPPAAVVTHFYPHLLTHAKLDEFLAKHNYESPTDAFNGPWQYAHGWKGHFFDWVASDPVNDRAFNTVMTINQQYRGQDWFHFFPVAEKLAAPAHDVLLIDIGGGIGHDISALKKAHPALSGKLVLQDLPSVVASAPVSGASFAGIRAEAHDMFNPQPRKGARAYYLRTVLHDWPDAEALKVLRLTREAMGPDSILLLNENLMPPPEQGLAMQPILVDFLMMTCMSSLERTEKQWIALLDEAGFKIERVWKPEGVQYAATALFEATPK